MHCNCESRLDSIMKFLEEMRREIGFVKKEIGVVKTKCIRIEKEVLGITAESEVKAEDLMETTTVRHLVEKLSFDLGVLTVESNNRAKVEAKRQEEIATATTELHRKFSEATDEKIKDLKLTYDLMAPETLEAEVSDFVEEFRSQAEKALSRRGFTNSVIYDIVEEVTSRTTGSVQLYDRHFSDKNKEMESLIREKYASVVQDYAKTAVDRMDDFPETGQSAITEFLSQFKLCEASFATFQEELLCEFGKINEQIEANRDLLERLTEDYRQFVGVSNDFSAMRRQLLEITLQREINVSDPKLVPIFIEKLRQNMRDLSNTQRTDLHDHYTRCKKSKLKTRLIN